MAGFSEKDAKRVAKATRIVERMVKNEGGDKRRPTGWQTGFWARITDREEDGIKYSWKQLEAKPNDSLGENEQELLEGDHEEETGYAIEANASEVVLKEEIVWLQPAASEDYYVFFYAPGIRRARTKSSLSDEIQPNNVNDVTVGDEEIEVHNPFSIKVARNKTILIGYSHAEARWYVVAEDCADGS